MAQQKLLECGWGEMNMKVLLINPPSTIDKNDYLDDAISPPLGLGYLSAYLLQHEHNVSVLDCLAVGFDDIEQIGQKRRRGLNEEKIKDAIKQYDPHLVGITSMFTSRSRDAHKVAQVVKSVNKEIFVVFGGCHASSSFTEVLNDLNIDMIVIGEGEQTLLEIVNNLSWNKPFDNIKGTAIKKNGSVLINEPRPFIEDLDLLPFPARDLFPINSYFKNQKKGVNYNIRWPFISMITSRGCPGHCVFCGVKTIWGRRWRARSPVNVVDEIEYMIKKYNVREIVFLDDNISVNRNRFKDICSEIIKRKLDIKWSTPNGIAIWTLDEELLRLMKKSGCFKLTFGLESGNKDTLKFIGKKYSYEHANNIIKYANKLGIITLGTFIIGFPFENKIAIDNTINYAISSDLDFAFFFTAATFQGTELFEITKKENLPYNPDSSTVIGGATSKYFTSKQLNQFRQEAGLRFAKSRLKKIYKYLLKIRSIEDFLYFIKLAKNFSQIFIKSKDEVVSTTALIRQSRR